MSCDKTSKSTHTVHSGEEFPEKLKARSEAFSESLLGVLQCVWDLIQMYLVTREPSWNYQPDSMRLLHFLARTFLFWLYFDRCLNTIFL